MPGSLVFRHQALRHGTINGGHRCFVSSFGCGFVARIDSFQNALDGRADMRTLAGIAAAVAF